MVSMIIGNSILQYPPQPNPKNILIPEESYYLIKLHQAQAFFELPILARPAYLTLSSSFESSFQPGKPVTSLFQITPLQRGQANRLPLSVHLTSFLPARSADTLRITLKYIVTRDNPFEKLTDKIKQLDLVANLSVVGAEFAIATKISQISGELLSYVLKEGKEQDIFEMVFDWVVSDLQAGYYVIIGSPRSIPNPKKLHLDENGQLHSDDLPLDQYCYATFKVIAIPARNENEARDRAWWQLLQSGKNQILRKASYQQSQAEQEWQYLLQMVKELAQKDPSFLNGEVEDIILKSQTEIDAKFKKTYRGEEEDDWDSNFKIYPPALQEILNVKDSRELNERVKRYEEKQSEAQAIIAANAE